MNVRGVEIFALREPDYGERDWWATTPLDILYERQTPRLDRRLPGAEARGTVSNVIVRVHADDGTYGLGTVGVGSIAAVPVIEHYLAPLIIGSDPTDIELLWQKMYRHTIPFGRKGLVIEALSAIDIALWDIFGKSVDLPVFKLLGGRTRPRTRAYASQLYARDDLSQLAAEASKYAADGFTAVKMRFGYGPEDGRAGMRANLELVHAVRDAVGPDVDIAGEAYMGWDKRYAIAMISALEEFELSWIEEPVSPDLLASYAEIRSKVRTPISGGEHEFTLTGFHDMLRSGAVDILQPDVNRMGGITPARKVWALAEAYDVPVIPHSNQAHNAHLITSSLNSPLIEVFPERGVRTGYSFYYDFLKGEPRANHGWVTLRDTPGLGIEMVDDVVTHHLVHWAAIGDVPPGFGAQWRTEHPWRSGLD